MQSNIQQVEVIKQAEDRLEVLKKIKEKELLGNFNDDVENDPPTIELKPNKIDYLRRKPINAIKNKIANFIMKRGIKGFKKNNQLIIKEVIGADKLNSVKNGAIITSNHFNPFDNFAVEEAFNSSKKKHKRLWKVIREANHTNPPVFGFFFKNCNHLPLSSNAETMKKFMKAIKTILEDKKQTVLIYPEQSMWWNYRKPRPLKPGAFKFAVNSNVPVVPMFVTMQDSKIIGGDGFPVQEYTVHVFDPIYPDPNLDKKTNIENMKNQNYKLWCDTYEKVYGKKLEFSTRIEN